MFCEIRGVSLWKKQNSKERRTRPAGCGQALLRQSLCELLVIRRSRPGRDLLGILGLEFHNVLSLIALGPFGDVEFNVIAFIQRFETTGLNSGMVHENIIPGIAPDESVAFFIVKPFNHALFFHSFLFVLHFKILRCAQGCILGRLFSFHS